MINIDFLEKYEGVSVIFDNKDYTYNELHFRILYYEKILKDYSNCNIAVVGDFNFETISLFLAFRNTNNVFIPLLNIVEDEVVKKLEVAKVNFIFKYNDFKSDFDISAFFEKENPKILNSGLILFSSGTTGVPKMMFHVFDNIFNVFRDNVKRQRQIRVLLFLMFDHIGGINTLLNFLKDGSTVIIPDNRSPDYVCDLIFKYGINVLPTTPTFLNLILLDDNDLKNRLKSLKLITYGTERMHQSLLLKIKHLLPHVKLLQTFGTSETGILKTSSKASDSLYFKIEDDRYEYKIINSILFIKSNLNISGYLNSSNEKFDRDGWYNTGDMVSIDEEGFIKIIGRVNEVINVGGLKVLPEEVELVLLDFQSVADCLVYGKLNSITGNVVCAKIVLHKDFKHFDEIELKSKIKSFCRLKLDKYKIPTKIEFVDQLEFSPRFKKIING
jgi:acyl-CoA synthetase (AMP-forming)/AMP-acid ligase II